MCLKSGKHFADSATTPRTTKIECRGVQTHEKSIRESEEEEASAMEEKDELPPHLDKVSLFGVHKMCIATDCEPIYSDNSDKESIFYIHIGDRDRRTMFTKVCPDDLIQYFDNDDRYAGHRKSMTNYRYSLLQII